MLNVDCAKLQQSSAPLSITIAKVKCQKSNYVCAKTQQNVAQIATIICIKLAKVKC